VANFFSANFAYNYSFGYGWNIPFVHFSCFCRSNLDLNLVHKDEILEAFQTFAYENFGFFDYSLLERLVIKVS